MKYSKITVTIYSDLKGLSVETIKTYYIKNSFFLIKTYVPVMSEHRYLYIKI